MADKTVSIWLKLEGSGDIKTLTLDAKELGKAMKATLKEAEPLRKSMMDLTAVGLGIDSLNKSLGDITSVINDLCGAYDVQIEAETKLMTVMQQRMGATEAEVQSIKDLCSAQQALGIIGDEVQLAGAQQMATFVLSKETLEQLIPAMNNLVAQQKGLKATGQDAVNKGNLLGKAMMGQTSALRRVGITFSEAEEKAVKFGSEQERAAALAKIITNNVGEMNAALAATRSGQQKQLENALGDVKEQIGAVIKGAQPYLTTFNQMMMAVGNGIKSRLDMAPATTSWCRSWHR